MSNIIRELSRNSSSRSLRSHDSSASALNNSAYNLESSSYKIMRFSNASTASSSASLPAASLAASSWCHHIKFNNSKFNEELNQIENQLKNSSNFVPEISLFEEESESKIFYHDKPPLNINIIRKRHIKRNPFVPEVELIKANYFSPENTAKRNYFQQLPPQVRNALRKQYEKYMQQIKMTIPFFLWFFKYRKPLKRIATLTSRKAIENYPHNKKLLDQQESSEKSREVSSETKFNQILFSSALGEVEETSTSKIEKTSEINEEETSTSKIKKTSESNKVQKIENKEKIKIIKTINVISSKVDKQIFFDVVDKIQDEEIQRTYLQNLKNLILTENPNKTQDIKPNQYSMDEIYNRFKKI